MPDDIQPNQPSNQPVPVTPIPTPAPVPLTPPAPSALATPPVPPAPVPAQVPTPTVPPAPAFGNPLAQPIKRPLPPPPPLTAKEPPAIPAPVAPLAPATATPGEFSVPTEDEIREEQQREKLAAESQKSIPLKQEPVKPMPMPAPVPTPAPVPAPAPAPTLTPPVAPVFTPLTPKMTPAPTVLRQTPALAPAPISAPAPVPAPLSPPTPPLPTAPTPFGGKDELLDLGGQKPRRPWLAMAIGAVVIVVLVGALWLLQSTGTIYLSPLAHIIGGLPRNPAKALTIIERQLANDKSYEYDSTVAVTLSSTLPDITDTTTATNAEATGTVKGQVSGDSSSANFEFTLAAKPTYPVVTLKGETVTTGDTTNAYIDTLGLLRSNNSWMKLSASDLQDHALTWPLTTVNLANVLAKAGTGTFRGATVLQNASKTPVLVYEYDVTSVLTPKDATVKQARLVLWVSKSDGRIQVAKLDSQLNTTAGVAVVIQQQDVISKQGQATVTALPSDAKPTDNTIAAIYQAFGIGGAPAVSGVSGTTSPVTNTTVTPGTPTGVVAGNINDAKRLADLTTLKAALEEYKKDYGLYPISKNRTKSTDSNFVLKGSLTPKYLAAIPTDPNGGSAYYGYTSDGFSFTLSSIIEDKTSPGAIAGSGYYYQEVKNN